MTTKPKTKKPDAAKRIMNALCNAGNQWRKENEGKNWPANEAEEFLRAQLAIEFPIAHNSRVDGRDVLFDAICVACGGDLSSLTRNYAKQVATAKRDIVEATPTVTPDEIKLRGEFYKAKYPKCDCSPSALAKHWPELSAVAVNKEIKRDYKEF